MSRSLCGLMVFALMLSVTGCGEPDNSKAPDFNKETVSNPGALKMDSSVTKKPK